MVVLGGLALGAPQRAAAQAVAHADLVGSWAIKDSTEYGFTFRADSTMTYVGRVPQGKAVVDARYRLANDTLTVSQVKAKLNGQSADAQFAKRLLALDKQQLTVTRTDNKQVTVYQKVDALTTPAATDSNPAPAPATPTP